MKECDYFRDLILTEYIDRELDKTSADGVESHLLACSDCRTYLKEVKNNTALLAGQASSQPVPPELWDAIKQGIEDKPPFEKFINGLKGWITFPRLVPVFASLVLMLLVGSVTVNTIQVQQAKDKDQGEYLVSLLSSSSQADNNDDSGTPVERYFL